MKTENVEPGIAPIELSVEAKGLKNRSDEKAVMAPMKYIYHKAGRNYLTKWEEWKAESVALRLTWKSDFSTPLTGSVRRDEAVNTPDSSPQDQFHQSLRHLIPSMQMAN